MFLYPVFIGLILYNLYQRTKIRVGVKVRPIELLVLLGYFLITGLIFYKSSPKYLGLVFLGGLILFEIIAFPGLGDKEALVFLGASPILKFVGYKDMKSIKIKDKDTYIRLRIKYHGTSYDQNYGKKDKEKIERLLGRFL